MGNEEKDPLPGRIASLVHAHFDALPKRSKPILRDDGTREWIPMTGIVVVKAVTTGAKCLSASQIPSCKGLVLHDWHAEILALRAFNFWLLSECHSVLAHEIHSSKAPEEEEEEQKQEMKQNCLSPFIRCRRKSTRKPHLPPFELHPDIAIYMYCTCAPCGDASMELCMAAQEDPTPWTTSSSSTTNPHPKSHPPDSLDGRAHFSNLGIVRRKPSRADAQATKSKSCSDKLALRQVSSLLGYEAGLLVAPTRNAYISGLVLPEEEITRVGCERAFGERGRMKDLGGRSWSYSRSTTMSGGTRAAGEEEEEEEEEEQSRNPGNGNGNGKEYQYAFYPFQVLSIPNEKLKSLWPFRNPRSNNQDALKKTKPGTISAVWIRAPTTPIPGDSKLSSLVAENGSKTLPVLRGSRTGLFENIINGVKQGYKASGAGPGARGASALSRAKLWGYFQEIVSLSLESDSHGEKKNESAEEELGALRALVEAPSYQEFKKEPAVSLECIRARSCAIQDAKEVLAGWVPNIGDENWGLEVLVDSKKRKR
ncbi:hypothetical protein AOCH_000989 [Aspergillus ochraceoroseus]|uniref:A to I editase domain-containing protein n=1 Tax=Aspergillus ochraceoroseus TaxID=138278 RepID=A0A0F8UTS3_9EURO|nr:hypothetical protein AOCH_000989 [Aspergillus ochraceoroseus]